MKCNKLVFHINSFIKNYGSIILILLFFIQLIILFIFIIKGIKSLKINILSLKDKSVNKNKNTTKKIKFTLTKNDESKRNRKKNFKKIHLKKKENLEESLLCNYSFKIK